jgi:hypothetical protein
LNEQNLKPVARDQLSEDSEVFPNNLDSEPIINSPDLVIQVQINQILEWFLREAIALEVDHISPLEIDDFPAKGARNLDEMQS